MYIEFAEFIVLGDNLLDHFKEISHRRIRPLEFLKELGKEGAEIVDSDDEYELLNHSCTFRVGD